MRSISRVRSGRKVGTVDANVSGASSTVSRPMPPRRRACSSRVTARAEDRLGARRPQLERARRDRPRIGVGERARSACRPRARMHRRAPAAARPRRQPFGSVPRSKRCDASVCMPSRLAVRRTRAGAKCALSSRSRVVAGRDLAVGAAHDAGDADGAVVVGDDEVVGRRACASDVVERRRASRPRCARRTMTPPPASGRRSNACSGWLHSSIMRLVASTTLRWRARRAPQAQPHAERARPRP